MVPTRRLIILTAAGSPLWLLAAVLPGAWTVPLVYLLALLFLSLWEYSRTPGAAALSVERSLPARLSLDSEQNVALSITNSSRQRLLLEARDDVPDGVALLSRFQPTLVAPGGTAEIVYRIKALQRGGLRFRRIHFRVHGGLGLVRRQFAVAVESERKVYPSFVGVDRYDLLAMIDRRQEQRKVPRLLRGQGSELESLRPYRPGEDQRRIDWKISAKRGTLISRNLQVEKGQQLTILIDAGRLMVEQIGERSRFEHALNAAVMLSYVAQEQGDAVSVACFSNRIHSFLPSVKGKLIMPRVLESLCDVQPQDVESDYWHLFASVLSRLKKRSLIVLLGEVLDRAGSSGLANNLARSARKHLVLCVVLRDGLLGAIADQEPAGAPESYRKAAAAHLVLERQLALDDMRSKGILVLETSPEHFSVQLIRRYLEIRKAGLL
jgi:uncharacterized protein (DUF58 family)